MAGKPKSFTFHWGTGVVEEEVQIASEYHRPTIQLLKFTDGAAKGTREIRFCHYDHHGRFQRSPLILAEEDLAALGRALAEAPRLKAMFRKLAKG